MLQSNNYIKLNNNNINKLKVIIIVFKLYKPMTYGFYH